MGWVVVTTPSGGMPVTESETGYPVVESDTGLGLPVTIVPGGGFPVSFVSEGGVIALSSSSVLESATIGTAIGTLSVIGGEGVYTFSELSDPSNKFTVSGSTLQTSAALNYETATSHTVEIQATNGVDDPITRTFTILVANVAEVTLAALTLPSNDIEEGSPEDTMVGALAGATGGSTLTLTDSAGGRFKLAGTNVVAGAVATEFAVADSHNITVRETHADATNTPRDTVLAIEVTEIGAFSPAYIIGSQAAGVVTTISGARDFITPGGMIGED